MDATQGAETGLRDRSPIAPKSSEEQRPITSSDGHKTLESKRRRRWIVSLSISWMKITSAKQSRLGTKEVAFVVLLLFAFVLSHESNERLRRSQSMRAITPRVIAITHDVAVPLRISKDQRPNNKHKIRYRDKRREQSKGRYAPDDDDDDDGDEDTCQPMHDWQTTMFPTCNKIHEFDLSGYDYQRGSQYPFEGGVLINNGHFRDVWSVKEFDGKDRALKTIRIEWDMSFGDIEKERKDGVAMERLTSSPHIPDIFGYCIGSGLFELSTGGDLLSHIRDEKWRAKTTQKDKLTIAVQVAAALADVHALDIAHTDIAAKQYILIDGMYKLNDFNRARMLEWNKKKNETCTFYNGKNPGVSRSPEEYKYKQLTNMIDVYSMGNIFYSLLMEMKVFTGVKSKTAQKMVMRGDRPKLNSTLTESTDPITVALIRAMRMCQEQKPKDRATAKEVHKFLISEAEKLGLNQKLRTAEVGSVE